jgi:hypothetical protein
MIEASEYPIFSARTSALIQMKSNRRADALMRTLGGDFLLREQFVTAPSQLVSEYLHSEKLPEEASSASDQLIYAVFSDEALLKTLKQRLSADPQAIDDSEKLADVLADAVAETGAKTVITALMHASIERVDVISRASVLALLLKGLLGGGVVANTEMSTGHSTATEMSTGHLVASTESSGGTMMTTGHSTGTMVSTAHLVASTESSGGTMMTTGHSTGTMVSTAHSMGEIFQGPFRATLIALADYSLALKRSGALDSAFTL